MQKKDLLVLLVDNEIDVNLWGIGKAKTFDDLFEEIEGNEISIEVVSGQLLRQTRVVSLDVISGQLRLVEDKQVFPDGRERRRTLHSSLGEKLYIGEIPEEGVKRALREELNIIDELNLKYLGEETRGPEVSLSYPGLQTRYTFYKFSVELPIRLFKEEYIEVSPNGKRTYFVWK